MQTCVVDVHPVGLKFGFEYVPETVPGVSQISNSEADRAVEAMDRRNKLITGICILGTSTLGLFTAKGAIPPLYLISGTAILIVGSLALCKWRI